MRPLFGALALGALVVALLHVEEIEDGVMWAVELVGERVEGAGVTW